MDFPIHFRELTTSEEIERFLERFSFYVGVKLSEAYARQGTVMGLYDELDTLIGGYMIITEPGFRILNMVPDAVKKEHHFFRIASMNDIAEVNGVWLSRRATRGTIPKTLWLKVLDDVIKTRKSYLLIMADAQNKNVQKVHQDLRPTFIYRGHPELKPGEASHKEIIVSYVSRTNMIVTKYFSRFFAPSMLSRTPLVRWVNKQIRA